MSKHNQDYRTNIRGKLLATASALALGAYVSMAGTAKAGDADRPPVWIEFGGQLNRFVSNQEDVTPPFFSAISAAGLSSPLDTEKAPKFSIDEDGKLSFRPDGSDWVFSASVQYGRSSDKQRLHQQTVLGKVKIKGFTTVTPSYGKFVETQWASTEKHTVLDFQAGKDVGLGMFGHEGTSEISFGVRVAQFSSISQAFVNADPTIHFPTYVSGIFPFFFYNIDKELYTENDTAERSFRGIGPTLSWQGSSPIAGNADSAELLIDWDARVSLLFGRQKARGHHQSSRNACPNYAECKYPSYHTITVGPDTPHDRSRRVTVPNIGGSLGISFKSGGAKISFGYRADLFMNAMDTGIDTAKKSNMLFHGPYASISVGLGD